jgi:hypothetical protein
MDYDEFNALTRGLRNSRDTKNPGAKSGAGTDASAFHGRPGAQVALLQSPILPAVTTLYRKKRIVRGLPIDKPHTRLSRFKTSENAPVNFLRVVYDSFRKAHFKKPNEMASKIFQTGISLNVFNRFTASKRKITNVHRPPYGFTTPRGYIYTLPCRAPSTDLGPGQIAPALARSTARFLSAIQDL